MKFSKEPQFIRPGDLSQQVAEFLASEIERGSFAVGQPLASEAELSYRFNVSRPIIREALARLKHEGVIETRQGSPTRIAQPGSRRVFSLYEPKQIDTTAIARLYEFRAIMQAGATALAAKRRSREDLKKLRRCLKNMELALRDKLDGVNANFEFHMSIIDAADNPFFSGLLSFLSDKLWELIQKTKQHTDGTDNGSDPRNVFESVSQEACQEHVNIVEAISAKDPARSCEACLNHSKNAARRRGISILGVK